MTTETRFRNRTDAGKLLANKLTQYADRSDVLVLGIPHGGVIVAFEVAKALNAPLDICLVRKLGVPEHPELAIGAIAAGGFGGIDCSSDSGLVAVCCSVVMMICLHNGIDRVTTIDLIIELPYYFQAKRIL